MVKERLTHTEKQILRALKQYHQQHGFYPTVRELAAAMGKRSFSNFPKYYRSLEAKGYMIRHEGSSPRLEFPLE